MWFGWAWCLRGAAALETRELVHAVERRGLVAFGQRRVIESRLANIVDLAIKNQHALPDVQQLRRAFAENVNAQQLARLAMEDELEASGGVAADLAPRDFAIVGQADFVRNVLFGELFLRLADERNFGAGVNPVGVVGRI